MNKNEMRLDNNSNEMKTTVQTYVSEDTVELIYDNEKLDKWNSLISELNLKGQSETVKTDKSPIPFMHINTSLRNVIDELCPTVTQLEAFDVTPIPLEVLELAKLSINENYFKELNVHWNEKEIDPFLVGVTCRYYGYKGKSWNSDNRTKDFATRQEVLDAIEDQDGSVYKTDEKMYLIARWGDENKSLEELKNLAMANFHNREVTQIEQQLRSYQRQLEDVEKTTFDRFN